MLRAAHTATRLSGRGTRDDPAQLVLLHRHADMADETSPAEARRDVELGADEIARLLGEVRGEATPQGMESVIARAHESLKGGGTYYSAVIAVISGSRVVASGIGDVSARLWVGEEAQDVLNATTVTIGNVRVLSSALGLGYERDRIQTAEVVLPAGSRMVIGVVTDRRAIISVIDHEVRGDHYAP